MDSWTGWVTLLSASIKWGAIALCVSIIMREAGEIAALFA